MTTYSTYQEAKIALGGDVGGVFTDGVDFICGWLPASLISGKVVTQSKYSQSCDPADYCMTVAEFFGGGHKFVEGDVFIGTNGTVIKVENANLLDEVNINSNTDEFRYILRAAAITEEESRTNPKLHCTIDKPFLQTGEEYEHTKTLNFIRDRLVEVHGEPKNIDYMHKLNNAIAFVERMEEAKISNDGFEPVAFKTSKGEKIKGSIGNGIEEKPKRTKVEYEKVEYNKPWEVIKLYDDGVELFKSASDELQMERINSIAIRAYSGYDFYRRVETEITEREEFVDAYITLRRDFKRQSKAENFYDFIADSGKFKLVD